ncbi:MAG TPA: PAS domain S-box protein [Verrucomicrobiae bacterium]|nr:PAS domain S-box protein [Verrucomicrobiae bacterium]
MAPAPDSNALLATPDSELPTGLFRQLLDAAPVAMVIADDRGNIVLVNAQVETLFGWQRAELLGQSIERLIPERLHDAQHGRRRDGTKFPVDVSLSPLDLGSQRLVIAAVRDVTERRRVEEALRENQQRLSEAQEIAHMGSWEWNITHNTLRWSDELYRIYGLEPDQFMATYEGYLQRLHEDDRARIHDAVQRAYRTHEPFEFLERVVRPGGEVRWLLSHGRVTCDDRGQPVRMTGTCQDITERKRAEQSFRELLEAAPDAMVMVGADGSIVLVNSQVERLFGWDRAELLGKPVEILIPDRLRALHEDHPAGHFAAPRARGMSVGLQLYGRRSDQTEFPIEISLSPVTTESGIMSMAAIRDITERKRVDAALVQRAEALARSNEELEQFAYVASHDLQEPLRTVASFTQLLQRRQQERQDPQLAQYVEFITTGVRQMQGLIEDLLAYSRVMRGSQAAQVVDLEDILRTALTNLAATTAAANGRVTSSPLPTVTGHHGQLVQLLQNLVGNALKYHGQAPPEVHISAHRDPHAWQISVADNGIGIDPAHFERIFVIFQRLHTRERYAGTGIGLALCRKIVTLHGGRIWAESPGTGKGSTFHFTLPDALTDS